MIDDQNLQDDVTKGLRGLNKYIICLLTHFNKTIYALFLE